MSRAVKVLSPGEPHPPAIDTLILTADERRTQRAEHRSAKGAAITFDFGEAIALRTDDLVQLDNGDVIEIVAAAEPLIEARADLPTLARLAWALGDRHVPVQILPNRIRFPGDDALQALVVALGGKATRIEAAFEPEGGAYATHQHAHDDHHGQDDHHSHHHGHDHHHDHGHRHHDHGGGKRPR